MKNDKKTKKGLKVFLAFAMTVVFVLSAVPFMAFAEEPSVDPAASSSTASSENISSTTSLVEEQASAASDTSSEQSSSEQSSSEQSSSEQTFSEQTSSQQSSSMVEENSVAPDTSSSAAPQQIQPTNEMEVTRASASEIRVHAYLINENNQAIGSNGQPLANGDKYIFATYNPRTEYPIAMDTEIQYYAEDVLTGAGELTYQFAGAIPGSDDPASSVILTDAQPVKDIYLAYTAKRSFTLYKKNSMTELGWQAFKKVNVMVGSNVSISSYYNSTDNPIALPANMALLGWSANASASTTDYPVFQTPSNNPDFVMSDQNISLYAVLQSQVKTGKIEVNRYLVNNAGVPVDVNGNPLPTDDKTDWVLLDSYFFTQNGSTDIPIGTYYKVYDSKSRIVLTNGGKEIEYDYHYPGFEINYISSSDSSFKILNEGDTLEASFGYKRLFEDTFHTNYPANSKDYSNNPMVEFSWVQNYYDTAAVNLNSDSNSAYDQLVGKMPSNFAFYGWSDVQNPSLTTNQDLMDIQASQEFYPTSTRSFAQPYADKDLYAVWGPADLGAVEIKQNQVIPYLVNNFSKPVNWDGEEVAFQDKIVLTPKHGFSFSNYTKLIPGVYYDLYPMDSMAANGLVAGVPAERTFTNAPYASNYGATPQPIRATIDQDGNLRDENNDPLTLYYGYRVDFKVFINTNYPAELGKTDVISQTTYNRIWGFNPTYNFYTELVPKGYTFYGFKATEKNSSNQPTEKFRAAYPQNQRYSFSEPMYSDLVLTAQWVPNSQIMDFKMYSYLVDYYGKPIDTNGYLIAPEDYTRDKVVLRSQPIYSSSLPYELTGSTYSYTSGNSVPTSITGDDGRTYAISSSNSVLYEDLTTSLPSPFTIQSSSPNIFYKGYKSNLSISVNLNPPKELGYNTPTNLVSSTLAVNEPISENTLKSKASFQNFDGYVFVGWSLEEDGLNSLISPVIKSGYRYIPTPGKNATIYAQWKKDDSQNSNYGNITVYAYATNAEGKPLDAQGNLVASPALAEQVRYFPYQNEGNTSLRVGYEYRPAALNFTVANKRFLYNPNAKNYGGNTSMDVIILTAQNKDVSLYFGYTYTASYLINYHSNLPAGTTSDQQNQIGLPLYANNRFAPGEIISDELATFSNSALPDTFRYQFAGWTESDTPSPSDTVYSTTGNSFTMPNNTAELYAKWIPFYTVEYLAGDHGTIQNPNASNSMRYNKVASGTIVPEAPQVTAEQGWEFEGWDNNYTQSMVVTADMQFTALWKKTPVSSSSGASSSSQASSSSVAPSSSSQASSSSVAPSSSSKASSSSVAPSSTSQVPSSSITPGSSQANPSSGSSSMAASSTSRNVISSSRASSRTTSPSGTSNTPANNALSVPSASNSNSSSGVASTTANATIQTNEEVRDMLTDMGVPSFQIGNSDIPLFGYQRTYTWSLASLLLALAGVITSVFVGIKLITSKEEKNNKRQKILRFISIALGVLSPILFLILYNLKSVMVLIDIWTIFFAILLAAELLVIFIAKRMYTKETEN